jgi:hypothetical protein
MLNEYLYQDLTSEIIRRFYIVYNKLGYGFLEKVYEKALKFDQLINYLKATNIEVGLLLNFGKKPEIRRKAFSNYNKKERL